MPKNIKEIMIALNQVLTTTVWVNEDRQIISLADELKIGQNNTPRSIEDLPRTSLVGAYIDAAFAEAKKIMDSADGSAESTTVAMAA